MRTTSKTVLLALFFASGSAGLIYELVWTRRLVLLFGGTTYAVTTVVAAFMAGLGLGGYLAGRLAHRLAHPGRAYGLLEVGIALSALLVPVLLGVAEPLYRALSAAFGSATAWLTLARFLVACLVLMVPTTLMGATLPVLVRYVTNMDERVGRSVGLLYGINTLGAVVGTMAAGFILLPAAGMSWTVMTAVGVSGAVGLAALVLLGGPARTGASGRASPAPPARPPLSPEPSRWDRRAALAGVALSGFAAMVYQISWTRSLVMSIGSTTYAFTCILAVFILGLGGGGLLMARWADRIARPLRTLGRIQLAIGLAGVMLVHLHGRMPGMVTWVLNQSGGSFSLVLAGSFALVILLTLTPTLLMGATFPLVVRVVAPRPEAAPAATGRAIALNTIGTVAGSILAGFLLIRSEVFGVRGSMVAAAVLNGVVGSALVLLDRPPAASLAKRGAALLAFVLALPVVGLAVGRWDLLEIASAPYLQGRRREFPGRKILYYADGVDATVSLEGDDQGRQLGLAINGKFTASISGRDMMTQLMLGHLPAMLVDEGRQACVIGLGSGITLSAIARYPSYQRIDCLEMSQEVIRAARWFGPYADHVLDDTQRVHVIAADGRNHLLLTDRRYDLISSEPDNLWIAGESNLFTREFFQLCRSRLTDKGVLCVWLHAYGMDAESFRSVAGTLCEVFESVSLWEAGPADFIFIARRDRSPVPLENVLERYRMPAIRADLYRIGFGQPARMLDTFLTGGERLRQWAASAPTHTDDHPFLEFAAPRNLYGWQAQAGPGEVPKVLATLQTSPFDGLLSISSTSRTHREVVAQVERAGVARSIRIHTDLQGRSIGGVESVHAYVSAYRTDPGNVLVYWQLLDLRDLAIRFSQDGAGLAAARWIVGRVNGLMPAILAPGHPKSVASLQDVARGLTEYATNAVPLGRWDLVLGYLQEVRTITPDLGEAELLLARAQAEVGDRREALQMVSAFLQRSPDHPEANYLRGLLACRDGDAKTALHHLEAALRSGKVTSQRLGKDDALRNLRENIEFQAMLARYATEGR